MFENRWVVKMIGSVSRALLENLEDRSAKWVSHLGEKGTGLGLSELG